MYFLWSLHDPKLYSQFGNARARREKHTNSTRQNAGVTLIPAKKVLWRFQKNFSKILENFPSSWKENINKPFSLRISASNGIIFKRIGRCIFQDKTSETITPGKCENCPFLWIEKRLILGLLYFNNKELSRENRLYSYLISRNWKYGRIFKRVPLGLGYIDSVKQVKVIFLFK